MTLTLSISLHVTRDWDTGDLSRGRSVLRPGSFPSAHVRLDFQEKLTLMLAEFFEMTRFADGAGGCRHEDVRVGDGVRRPVGGGPLIGGEN